MERQHIGIFQEGFGWGCFSPRNLCRVDVVDRGEDTPWLVELNKLFDDDILEVSDFFNDS